MCEVLSVLNLCDKNNNNNNFKKFSQEILIMKGTSDFVIKTSGRDKLAQVIKVGIISDKAISHYA